MFAENIGSTEMLFVQPARLEGGNYVITDQVDASNIDVDSILRADVLIVAPKGFTYNPSRVTTVKDVKVTIASKNPNKPKEIGFWSGGTYVLSSGYSIRQCYNLGRTIKIKLGGEVTSRVAKEDDMLDDLDVTGEKNDEILPLPQAKAQLPAPFFEVTSDGK